MTKVNSVGISLPAEIISKIDAQRGDIPRSRYILRVLQDTYPKKRKLKEEGRRSTVTKNIDNSKDSPDCKLETLQSSEFRSP
jgi:metal-responsive CopG/Arc/MetJ family transcriptional regulator